MPTNEEYTNQQLVEKDFAEFTKDMDENQIREAKEFFNKPHMCGFLKNYTYHKNKFDQELKAYSS